MDEFDAKQNVELSTRDLTNIIQALPQLIRKIEYQVFLRNRDMESYQKKIDTWKSPDQIKSLKESKSKVEKEKNKLEKEIDSIQKLGTRLENEIDLDLK